MRAVGILQRSRYPPRGLRGEMKEGNEGVLKCFAYSIGSAAGAVTTTVEHRSTTRYHIFTADSGMVILVTG